MSKPDRTVLVTGGRGGIGAAIVSKFLEAGCNVVAVDISASGESSGGRLMHLQADITQKAQVHEAVAKTVNRFGGLDVLVNAAGVVSFGSAAQLEEVEWDRILDINLKGVFLMCQAVMPAMKAARSGRIVNIGSIIGKNGGNARPWIDSREQERSSNVAYGASKAGVHALTLFLSRELAAFGVTVNAVAPGPIASAMTQSFPDTLKALIPVGRMGTAGDVAEAVYFLASETSSFVTGEILDVNGGAWPD